MQCQQSSKEGIIIETRILDAFDISKDLENIRLAAEVIKNGGLVGFPTETVYGLGANALDSKAVEKIFIAKGRPQDNPLIVHVSSLEMIEPLVLDFDDKAKALADKFWPGPLTIIMNKSEIIPDSVSAGLKTVAIRFPSNLIARELISLANVPIAAPSANLSGSPSPTTARHVIEDLSGRIDVILNSSACEVGLESTVISLAGETPRLLRPGYITPKELESVLGKIEIDKAVFQSISNDTVVNAPGMKYKHYSPKALVKVVKGSFEEYKAFVEGRKEEGIAALCFSGEGKKLSVPFVEFGNEEKSEQQAVMLFDALRRLDEIGAKIVYARCPSAEGVGLAVTNRLFKAAGFEVIEL